MFCGSRARPCALPSARGRFAGRSPAPPRPRRALRRPAAGRADGRAGRRPRWPGRGDCRRYRRNHRLDGFFAQLAGAVRRALRARPQCRSLPAAAAGAAMGGARSSRVIHGPSTPTMSGRRLGHQISGWTGLRRGTFVGADGASIHPHGTPRAPCTPWPRRIVTSPKWKIEAASTALAWPVGRRRPDPGARRRRPMR